MSVKLPTFFAFVFCCLNHLRFYFIFYMHSDHNVTSCLVNFIFPFQGNNINFKVYGHQIHQKSEQNWFQSSTIAVYLSTMDESSPKIFKLNVDCFECKFEWLSLNELLAFRLTCKRMKQVVDYYIKLNYPQKLHLELNESDLEDVDFFELDYFKWIKRLRIGRMDLTHIEIDNIEHILTRLETIELSNVIVHGDFYDNFLQHCTNLKRLSIENVKKERSAHIFGTGTQWMLRNYSTLEHFGLKLHRSYATKPELCDCTALLNFFTQNPNI